MSFVSALEPTTVWAHFDRILAIPRGSGEEEAMRAYVIDVAERNGLPHEADSVGNIVVRKPGAVGHEEAEITVLQSHLDMVNEKNADTAHDFSSDPLIPERDGEYLAARGTTLGADNGIGVAAMLALMDADDMAHGPLELLFTVDEESGLTGASRLDPSLLRGRRLINLDTEEEDAIYVGCAGGGASHLSLPLTRVAAPEATTAIRVSVRGLRGGHSGVDIHLQRGNAIALLARLLAAAARGRAFHVAAISGGDKHNAIPREAGATVVVADTDQAAFRDRLDAELRAARDAFSTADPGLRMEVELAGAPETVLDQATSWRALRLLQALPHGVAAVSQDIPGLVETSTNIARVRTEGDHVEVLVSTRSSLAGELHAMRARVRAIADLARADVREDHPYPGWQPDLRSPILAVVKEVYHEELGRDPAVRAIHAGLETGIIGEKVPGMDMVSIGPQIEFPHSPDERVRIPSVAPFYARLVRVLERLA